MSELPKAPELDTEKLTQIAQEAAMKGAIQEINEFYNGYKSPYREAIKKSLEEKAINIHFDLPDIIATLNDALVKEIDKISNACIAQTFLPMIQEMFLREDKELKFSDILQKYLDYSCWKDEPDKFTCTVSKDDSWLKIKLTEWKDVHEFRLMEEWETRQFKDKKDEERKYSVHIFRSDEYSRGKMEFKTDKWTVTMPFTKDILQDQFMAYLARLMLSGTIVTMDCEDFDEEWFESEEHDND